MPNHQLNTQKGHSLFEVASALQKSIRRGLEDEAMYWAVELFESGYDSFCWKRLRIISSEDVGLANPFISQQIYSLWMMYQEQKKVKDEKNRPERLFLTHAIFLLARSKKSRIIDHALLHYWAEHETDDRKIPGFAYDKHTREGKRLGFGWKHFFEEATQLGNLGKVKGETNYKTLAQESILNPSKKKEDPKYPTLFRTFLSLLMSVLH